MQAIVNVESGGNSLALHDNTTTRSYAPPDYRSAVTIANALIARGDSVDVGLAQINSANFLGYRVTPAAMLTPCQNLIVSSEILGNAYTRSIAVHPDPRAALWGAISAYNTGSLYAGARYVAKVVAESFVSPIVPAIEILRPGTRELLRSQPPAESLPKRTSKHKNARLSGFAYGYPNQNDLAIKLRTK